MFNILSEINSDTFAIGLVVVILSVLMTVALALVAVFLIGKFKSIDNENTVMAGKLKTVYVVAIILFVGLAIRLLFTFVVNGYGQNFESVYNLGKHVLKDGNGFEGFTSNYIGVAPIMGYLYAFFAGIGTSFNLAIDDIAMQLFIKLPYILADIALFIAIFVIAKKYCNRYIALTVSSLYYLSPLSFAVSSMWGSDFSVLALTLVITFYFMLNKNALGMALGSAVSCLVSADAVVIVPVVGVYLVYAFVQSIIKIIKVKPSFDMLFGDSSLYNVFYVPLSVGIGVALMYLLSLPAYFPDGVITFPSVMEQLLIKPYLFVSGADGLYYFSQNALSIYTIFGQNYKILGTNFPTALFAGMFALLVAVVSLVVFLMKKNRANLVLLTSFLLATLAIFLIGANEWSLLPSLALMLVAFVVIKDKRILKVFTILSTFVVLNAVLVMFGGNQISSIFTEGYFNVTTSTGISVFNILLSVFTVLTYIYFAVVVLDISLTKNRKLLDVKPTASFGEVMKNWIRG